MRPLDKLESLLCDELQEFAEMDKLSSADLDAVHKITSTMKNIQKIENSDYSQRNYYGDRHYVRAHYSRNAGSLTEQINRMLDENDLTSSERNALMCALEKMR